MPGFFVSPKRVDIDLINRFNDKCISEELSNNKFGTVKRNTLNKFLCDKAFTEKDSFIIVLEGYILNKKSLMLKYSQSSIDDLVERLYTLNGETFFEQFRGCFSGALYDKKKDKWIIYTNQIGDNPIFYCNQKGQFAAGSQVNYLLDFCNNNDINLSFNESAAYQMLTYGYIVTDDTFANEINRLRGGDYIVWEKGKVSIKNYHRFQYNPQETSGLSDDELIEIINNSFVQAVELEWNKDDEYGLPHLADLSGGLDSRMNMWVAHTLKKRVTTIITYSKAGYLDETIAKEISKFWKDEFYCRTLDDLNYMLDIDENTALLEGMSFYSGITGGKRFLELIRADGFGIEHTGMVGDIALSSFFHSSQDEKEKLYTGRESEKLTNRLSKDVNELSMRFSSYEIYLMYIRGFRGACNTHLLRKNYTEVGSPFLNVDFLQTCYNISFERRMNHNLYKKWILKYYPEAAQFVWEKTGGTIDESRFKCFSRKAKWKVRALIEKYILNNSYNKENMNPLDYWLSDDNVINEYLDNYTEETYRYIMPLVSNRLIEDMKSLYSSGNVTEKSLVLTVLSATKYYFYRNGTSVYGNH